MKHRRKYLEILQHLKLCDLFSSLQKQKPRRLTRGNILLCGSAAGVSLLNREHQLLFSIVSVKFHSVLPAVLRELCFFYFHCLICDGRREFSSLLGTRLFSHLLIFLFFLVCCSQGRDLSGCVCQQEAGTVGEHHCSLAENPVSSSS